MKGPSDPSHRLSGVLPLESGAGAESWHMGLWMGPRSEPVLEPHPAWPHKTPDPDEAPFKQEHGFLYRGKYQPGAHSPSQQGWRENRNLEGKHNPRNSLPTDRASSAASVRRLLVSSILSPPAHFHFSPSCRLTKCHPDSICVAKRYLRM